MAKKTANLKHFSRLDTIFIVLYIVWFLGAGIIGFFGNSFFAYDIFNSLWADILYVLFISLLFVTAFVQDVIASRKPLEIVFNFFAYLGSMVFFLLPLFFGRVLDLCALIYSAVIFSVIVIRCALILGQTTENTPYKKQILSSFSLLIFAMLRMMTVAFVNEKFIAWSMIPAAIITCVCIVVAYFLLRGKWNILFKTKAQSIYTPILCVVCAFVIALLYSYTAVGIINCAFDGEPTSQEYVVQEKKVRSGARQVTQHEVKVIIDGKEKWIDVSVTDYYKIDEGDVIILDYYNGALGFAYWEYNGPAENGD